MDAISLDSARRAYDALASFYDDFTASYEATAWTGQLLAKAEEFGLRGRRLLDVGCGTGKSTLPMVERGWKVTGCDFSSTMLEIARAKLGDDSIRLELADVRKLATLGEFDLVWAVNDTLSYMLSEEELRSALTGMRENLVAEGFLIFDLNTLQTFRTIFAVEEAREGIGQRMVWRGKTAPDVAPGSICEAELTIGGDSHSHYQRHFPQEAVLDAIERSTLVPLGQWGELEGKLSQPLDEARHTKAVYLCQRRA